MIVGGVLEKKIYIMKELRLKTDFSLYSYSS